MPKDRELKAKVKALMLKAIILLLLISILMQKDRELKAKVKALMLKDSGLKPFKKVLMQKVLIQK
jgi:hypothetical protein